MLPTDRFADTAEYSCGEAAEQGQRPDRGEERESSEGLGMLRRPAEVGHQMLGVLLASLRAGERETGRTEDVRLAREGSIEDLGRYVEELRPRLMGAVRRSFPTLGEDTEDVVQSAALRLLEDDARTLRRFSGKSKLSTYIMSVVRRTALDALRRRKGEDPLPEDAEQRIPGPAEGQPEHIAEQRETARDVHAALVGLPRRQRQAMAMHYMAHMTCADIAAALNISTKRVTALLSEGRRRLAEEEALWTAR
jgi:RNA polymerase sigma-70 factor (ECF subfamily)